MTKKHRPSLTQEEIAEKTRIKALYEAAKKRWKLEDKKLTDEVLGDLVANAINRKEGPYSQGAVYQFTSPKNGTRMPPEFVQGMALVLGFKVEEISEKFLPKESAYAKLARRENISDDSSPYITVPTIINSEQETLSIDHLIQLASPTTEKNLQTIRQAVMDGKMTDADVEALVEIANRMMKE